MFGNFKFNRDQTKKNTDLSLDDALEQIKAVKATKTQVQTPSVEPQTALKKKDLATQPSQVPQVKPKPPAATTTVEPKKEDSNAFLTQVTFYGKTVRKLYRNAWFFHVEDIVNLAQEKSPDTPVSKKKDFNQIYEEIITTYQGEPYATATNLQRLLSQVEGVFPGALTRWLTESGQLPAPQTDPD